MKKTALLVCLLVAAALTLTSCTLLPLSGLKSMLPTQRQPAAGGDDLVTMTREEYERYRKFDSLLELMDIVEESYYEDVDEDALLENAAAGLLDGVGDPYTFYYTPEEYAELWEDDAGEYAGIGIQISISYEKDICTVSRVFEGGPAEQAGVHRGDIIYLVEDLYVSSDNIDDAIKLMRRTPGTQVHVTFLRDGEEVPFTLTCANVVTNRVEHAMMPGQVGYIRLYEFAGDCAQKFTDALHSLEQEGARGLIIDLRDNGGGWVNDAETIADLFLDAGTMCYLQYKDGSREYYRTRSGKTELPLVLLMNQYSASASEILAGALRDRAGATVVGMNSYGKGIVQVVLPVGSNGAGMQVTVAQYFTPAGTAVHKVGIAPDVEIDLPEEDVYRIFQLADLEDVQLKKAYDVMLEKLDGQ